MPRAESKPQLYTNSTYADSNSSSSPQLSPAPQSQSSSSSTRQSSTVPSQKKKHVCPTCERPFSTSGHLARHARVHTGERNHKCPFPGCETRCSRQDNLQQHYRIHLSPGSRRSSTRSSVARAMNSSGPGKRAIPASVESPPSPPPLSPPALEPARIYSHHSTPPDSPPPLAQATLPATAHLPSSSRRSSTPPELSYPQSHHLGSISSQSSNHASQPYSYRSGTTTYQEQSQGAGFTYVHTTPLSHSSTSSNPSSFSSYSNSHNGYTNHSLPQINTSPPILHPRHHHDSPNPTPISSRHSISHISHPHSYSQNQPSSAGPASPASSHSVSSQTSGPATPSSYVYHDDSHAYHHHNGTMIGDQQGLSNVHSHLVHQGYSSMSVQNQHHQGRFDSPPPVLAPIQEPRYIHHHRDERHSQSRLSGSYLHQPQPIPTEYQYHQSMALGHGAWKSESGMRKGVGALVQ
ncbi:hypothetical protein Hypma_013143 [Hypsizygus marmoreus]|uniref:C2H2-type domain-containing protein n=1 Tax=Hypsizygus marmoreus TaxID=39966 RepID=A0A369JDI5_HYPMA|nr:hypothetical protein Hypma_013143 [Hypsizygus marmoreus]